MECDHNEMGGAEMSLRSKLAVLGLTATLAPFGAQAGESVTYTVDGADYEGYSAPAEGSAKGLVLIIHDWDGLTGYEEIGRAHVELQSLMRNSYAVFCLKQNTKHIDTS